MPPHIFHQPPDDEQAHHKRHHAPHDQHADLCAGGGDAAEQKFQPLDGGRPQHGGDGHEEGEFRAGAASHADEDRTQNGGAGTGGAGDQAQALEAADEQGGLIVDGVHVLHRLSPHAAGVAPLHQNEGHAVDDQRDGDHGGVMEVGFHPVVKQHAHDARGDDGGDDLEPQLPCLLFLPLRLPGRERVELMEEQDDHGQNRPQLDDHVEHAPEFVGNVQGNEFVQ